MPVFLSLPFFKKKLSRLVILVIYYYKFSIKREGVWLKLLAEVDGEKMEGGFVGNYFFCVPTIAAATPEGPKPLRGGKKWALCLLICLGWV